MNNSYISNPTPYTAISITSPMIFGDEKKDQDRVRWFGPGQIAGVSDGVTSSPNSGEAAGLVTSFVPALFNGSPSDRLKVICDLLMALRQECQQSEPAISEEIPESMKGALQKVVREKKATSYQTTIVAARFISDKDSVLARVAKCGDSAFFAFSNDGEVLTSSFEYSSGSENHRELAETCNHSSFSTYKMSFKPGDQILVRVEGQLSKYTGLARRAGIKEEHIGNWLVCIPVDACSTGKHDHAENLSDMRGLSLQPGDWLLVPKYLYGKFLTSEGKQYRVLDFSSTIKPVFTKAPDASGNHFHRHCSATMVLPDHYYCGYFDCFKDRFPPQTQFILCSDGMYGSFSDAKQLWRWLRDNAETLSHESERDLILKQLHSRLHDKGGDDDISFIWVFPRNYKSH